MLPVVVCDSSTSVPRAAAVENDDNDAGGGGNDGHSDDDGDPPPPPDPPSSSSSASSSSSSILECPVCLQTCVHPVQLPCNHIFCFLCVKGVLANQRRRCALCRKDIPPEFLDNPKLVSARDKSVLGGGGGGGGAVAAVTNGMASLSVGGSGGAVASAADDDAETLQVQLRFIITHFKGPVIFIRYTEV